MKSRTEGIMAPDFRLHYTATVIKSKYSNQNSMVFAQTCRPMEQNREARNELTLTCAINL